MQQSKTKRKIFAKTYQPCKNSTT